MLDVLLLHWHGIMHEIYRKRYGTKMHVILEIGQKYMRMYVWQML